MPPKAKPGDSRDNDALSALKKMLETSLDGALNWGDDPEYVPEKVPLGIQQLDRALGGGFSMKRMTLLVGEESAGKTLLAMMAIKAAQARGLPCVFIDVERSWTAEWARTVGIDPSQVIVSTPKDGEHAFDVARAVAKTEPAGVLVLDSIAAMPPAAELEASSEQQFMGTQARMVNKGIRTLNAENTGGWMILVINQIREKIGVVYGNPETLPGGKGQRYYAWQIVRVRKGAAIEEGTGKDKRLVGRMLRIKLDKNKQAPPGAEAEVPFYFTGEFDVISGMIDLALELGVIEAGGGAYFTFAGVRHHGRRALRDWFGEDETRLEALTEAVAAVDHVEDLFETPEELT